MRPRADFYCPSKKCRTDEGAPKFELPVDATRCPMCGSKRLTRLFDQVGVIGTREVQPEGDSRLTSSSHFQRSTAMLQPMMDQREASRPPDNMHSHAVPISQLTGGDVQKGRPMNELEVASTFREDMKRFKAPTSPSSVLKLLNRSPIPTTVRAHDR